MLPHHSHPSGESQSQTLSWLAWESLRAALGDAGALERIAGVTASQDWMELVDEADRLRLSGLLYPACREAAAQGAALPAAVLAALHRQARLVAARHARLAHATA